jgi:hypothetical protein
MVLVSSGSIAQPVAAQSSSILWSAGFESGTQSEFNYGQGQVAGGAVVATTTSVQYEGSYSGYYYYLGPAGGQESRRAYPTHVLTPRPSKFLVEAWAYVPSSVDGQVVALTDWVSFVSLWLNDGGSNAGINPITIDSTTRRELTLWLGTLPSNRDVYQAAPVKWPLDKWFKIGVQGDLQPGTANSRITVFQDGVAIISWVGNLGDQANGLGQMHFGLYMGSDQGTFAVHNDAISVQELQTAPTPPPAQQSKIGVTVKLEGLRKASVKLVLAAGSTVVATKTLSLTTSAATQTVTFQVDAGTYTLTLSGKGLKTQTMTITVPPDVQLTLTTLTK